MQASNLRSCDDLFAGCDAERLDAFHQLAADPGVEAIVFARGGHGILRVLPGIDWRLLARRPRAYVGYSDLTPLLLQVVQRLGLVAFHGPMAAADFARGLTAAETESLEDALAGRYPRTLAVASGPGPAREGILLGGCLSMIASTLGTPWAPRLDGAILFLEEINEPLYRFDRMLTHLRLSGNLTGIRGVVSGHLTCVGGAEESERHGTPRCRELLRELADEVDATFAWGLEAGHDSPNLTLPLGMWARLEPERGRLLLDPAR